MSSINIWFTSHRSYTLVPFCQLLYDGMLPDHLFFYHFVNYCTIECYQIIYSCTILSTAVRLNATGSFTLVPFCQLLYDWMLPDHLFLYHFVNCCTIECYQIIYSCTILSTAIWSNATGSFTLVPFCQLLNDWMLPDHQLLYFFSLRKFMQSKSNAKVQPHSN